ncbi:MAG: phospho-sugar mutase [Bdellovibrio sp.]|nr:phospho-sugar mutase [Bdellovibrio sp.]
MTETIQDTARNWLKDSSIEAVDRQEVENLLNTSNEEELTDRFYREMEFGTGGIRGIMGIGANRMNKYNIRKATYALGEVVKKSSKAPWRVSICYDSRKNSYEFSKECAQVLAAMGIEAYIYPHLNPVALLSFAVRYLKAHAGIMVTASHNPPKYNGYKVYWSDGAQVTPPHDQMIIERYNAQRGFAHIPTISFEEGQKRGLIKWISNQVEDEYFRLLQTKFINPSVCEKHGQELKLVYTPIHGAGKVPCLRALARLNISQVITVPEQIEPDGTFPTVKSPNPENPEAMKLAVDLMLKSKADVAFATDPDCDRLGVALIHNGGTHYLSGNQIGILMLNYILTNLKEQKRLPSNPYFVKTIVTTPLQDTIAAKFGVKVENTLTGFKWICRRMGEMEREHPECNFIFATEESFGYMNHNYVRDKDGICSVALMAELALWYKLKGLNLMQALDEIYETYGFSSEALLTLDYEGKSGAEKIKRIMERFRSQNHRTMCGQTISQAEDYKAQEKTDYTNGQVQRIDLPQSDVLGYAFPSGDRLYLRPSGTEPKIKFYIMVQERRGDLATKKKKAGEKIDAFLSFVKKESELA